MKNRVGIQWVLLLLLGMMPFISLRVLADNKKTVATADMMRCKASLRQFGLHLEEQSKQRANQAYYGNLYQQTHDFLQTLEGISLNSSQLNKCENLLKVIQKIVGIRGTALELGPLPHAPRMPGKLTSPLLETMKRTMRKSIRYVVEEEEGRDKEKIQEAHDPEPAPTPCAPNRRKSADWEEETLD